MCLRSITVTTFRVLLNALRLIVVVVAVSEAALRIGAGIHLPPQLYRPNPMGFYNIATNSSIINW